MSGQNSCYDRYVKDIGNYPRISREREEKLCKIIASGKNAEQIEAAVNELVNANLRLVIHCVKSFTSFLRTSKTSITVMDLVAEGNLALVKAAQNFNPAYQTKDHAEPIRFSAYACKCIKNAMRKAFRKARFIHIPDHHYSYWKKINDLSSREEGADDKYLQEQLDIKASRLKTIKQGLRSNTVMLEDIACEDGESHWSDIMEDDKAINPHAETDASDLRGFLIGQMDCLPDRTKEMLAMMFLDDHKPTLHDLSMHFGVSKERCRQVCARGLQLLRNQMQNSWDHVEHVEIMATQCENAEMVLFPQGRKLSVA